MPRKPAEKPAEKNGVSAFHILLYDLLYSGAVCSPAFIEECIKDLERWPIPYDDGSAPGLLQYVDSLMARLNAIQIDATQIRRKRDGR